MADRRKTSLWHTAELFPDSLLDRARLNSPKANSIFSEINVVHSLKKDPKERTQTDLNNIVILLKENPSVASFGYDKDALMELAKDISFRRFPAEDQLYRPGDDTYHLYILFDGEITLSRLCPSFWQLNREEVNAEALTAGEMFGCPLNGSVFKKHHGFATVTSKEGASVLVISRKALFSANKRNKAQRRDEIFKFLSNCIIFRGWDKEKIDSMVSKVKHKEFDCREEILSSGEKSLLLYIIKKGQVAVVKAVPEHLIIQHPIPQRKARAKSAPSHRLDRSFRSKQKQALRHSTSSNSCIRAQKQHLEFGQSIIPVWALNSNWFQSFHLEKKMLRDLQKQNGDTTKYKNITANILSSGEVFGELAAMKPGEESPVSVVAMTHTEVLIIKSDLLEQLQARFHIPLMEYLHTSFLTNNPPYQKLVHYTREHLRWSKQQPKLVDFEMKESKQYMKMKKNAQTHQKNNSRVKIWIS